MNLYTAIMIFVTAWLCSNDTNIIFNPALELAGLKLTNSIGKMDNDEEFSKMVDSSPVGAADVAVRHMITRWISIPMLLFSPYPLSTIVLMVYLIHIFRDRDYAKKGAELTVKTVRKWAITSNLAVILFMVILFLITSGTVDTTVAATVTATPME